MYGRRVRAWCVCVRARGRPPVRAVRETCKLWVSPANSSNQPTDTPFGGGRCARVWELQCSDSDAGWAVRRASSQPRWPVSPRPPRAGAGTRRRARTARAVHPRRVRRAGCASCGPEASRDAPGVRASRRAELSTARHRGRARVWTACVCWEGEGGGRGMCVYVASPAASHIPLAKSRREPPAEAQARRGLAAAAAQCGGVGASIGVGARRGPAALQTRRTPAALPCAGGRLRLQQEASLRAPGGPAALREPAGPRRGAHLALRIAAAPRAAGSARQRCAARPAWAGGRESAIARRAPSRLALSAH